MDFFAQQDRVRRRVKLLVVYYILAVIFTWLAIYALTAVLFSFGNMNHGSSSPGRYTVDESGQVVPVSERAPQAFSFFSSGNLSVFGVTFVAVVAVVGLGSLFKISQLSSGGGYVASMMGGEAVDPNTRDPLERRLVNVVEEMSIASGVQVPGIFVMRHEQGINAFAAGYSIQDAAVCVTRGTLEYLNRDELQGVIGHEFSHILNGDMRFNIRLIGVLFGLQMIGLIGWMMVRNAYLFGGRSSDNKNGGGAIVILLLGLGILIIGSIGMFFCSLIQAAISRQREYLADASAVQFTRNPAGIASALKKIGAVVYGSQLQNSHALQAAHMFYASPMSSFAASLMATHPPLKERIRAIDPAFDGRFPAKVDKLQSLGGTAPDAELARQRMAVDAVASGRTDRYVPRPGGGLSGAAGVNVTAASMLESIGQITAGNLAIAAALLDSIPQAASEQVRSPAGARAMIYALLLDNKPEIRNRQLTLLSRHTDEKTVALVMSTAQTTDPLADELRVPLVETAFPALRNCERDDYVRFRGVVEALVNCDGRVDLFEYTLQAMLIRDLDVHFKLAARLSTQFYAPKGVAEPFTLVLSLLAYAGQDNPGEINAAFEKGRAAFGFGGPILPKDQCTTQQLDAALRKLAHAAMPIKQKLIEAFTVCIWADGKVVPRERELLRAIAAMLGCPMPPLAQVVSR